MDLELALIPRCVKSTVDDLEWESEDKYFRFCGP